MELGFFPQSLAESTPTEILDFGPLRECECGVRVMQVSGQPQISRERCSPPREPTLETSSALGGRGGALSWPVLIRRVGSPCGQDLRLRGSSRGPGLCPPPPRGPPGQAQVRVRVPARMPGPVSQCSFLTCQCTQVSEEKLFMFYSALLLPVGVMGREPSPLCVC